MFKQRITAVCTIIIVFLLVETAAVIAVSYGFGIVSEFLKIPDIAAIPLTILFLGFCANILFKYFYECKKILSVGIGFSNIASSHLGGVDENGVSEPKSAFWLTRDARAVYNGICLFFGCEYFESLRQFEKALETAEGSDNIAFCHSWIAECYLALGKQQEALRAYEKVILAAPSDRRALVNLAKCYYVQGKPDKVVYCCEEALKYGDSWIAQQLLGEAALAKEDYAAAAAHFEKAEREWSPRVRDIESPDNVIPERGDTDASAIADAPVVPDAGSPQTDAASLLGGDSELREPIRINNALAFSALLSGSAERSEQYLLRVRREWGEKEYLSLSRRITAIKANISRSKEFKEFEAQQPVKT